MAERLTLKGRTTYNTLRNRRRKIRTPGNRLSYQKIRKTVGPRRCPISKAILGGIPTGRPKDIRKASRSQRTVSRPYGGCLSHKVVKDKILRAFLYEEKRCVINVLKEKAKQRKKTDKKSKNPKFSKNQ